MSQKAVESKLPSLPGKAVVGKEPMTKYQSISKATHVYIGRIPECGCVVAVTTDIPGYGKDTGKSVAEFIKCGYTVERIPLAALHDITLGCSHKKPKEKKPPDLFESATQ